MHKVHKCTNLLRRRPAERRARPTSRRSERPAPGTKKSGRPAATAKTAAAKPKPPAHDPKATRILDLAGLGEVTVYAPKGEARGLALFASGDGNWNLGVWDMAHTAADLGYWVAGFSTPAFLKALENGDGECSDASGLLDHIGSKVKTEFKLPADWRPVLIGYSSGATIMYAALAQAGDTRFGGAMTLGFCPDLIIHKPFCEGAGLTADKQTKPPYGIVFNTVPAVKAPWIVLQGDIDQVCNPPATEAFVEQVKGGQRRDAAEGRPRLFGADATGCRSTGRACSICSMRRNRRASPTFSADEPPRTGREHERDDRRRDSTRPTPAAARLRACAGSSRRRFSPWSPGCCGTKSANFRCRTSRRRCSTCRPLPMLGVGALALFAVAFTGVVDWLIGRWLKLGLHGARLPAPGLRRQQHGQYAESVRRDGREHPPDGPVLAQGAAVARRGADRHAGAVADVRACRCS